ncbi:copper chaperone CopZ [Clostridia bacterium]|nr:copper chaperone CopZ [Clostridia bacterium]
METTIVKVEGMSCEHCVKAVKDAVGGLDGVSGVVVELKGGTATVSYDPKAVTLEAIKVAIVEEGYTAG